MLMLSLDKMFGGGEGESPEGRGVPPLMAKTKCFLHANYTALSATCSSMLYDLVTLKVLICMASRVMVSAGPAGAG